LGRLQPPKCNKKDDTGLGCIFPLPANSNREREKLLNLKAMITYKGPTTIGHILTNCKHLALSKTREYVKGVSGPCSHCALCGCHGKHNKSTVHVFDK